MRFKIELSTPDKFDSDKERKNWIEGAFSLMDESITNNIKQNYPPISSIRNERIHIHKDILCIGYKDYSGCINALKRSIKQISDPKRREMVMDSLSKLEEVMTTGEKGWVVEKES